MFLTEFTSHYSLNTQWGWHTSELLIRPLHSEIQCLQGDYSSVISILPHLLNKTLLASGTLSSFPRLSCDKPIASSKASSQQRGPYSAPGLKFQVSLLVPKTIQQLLTSSSSRCTLNLGTVYVYAVCLFVYGINGCKKTTLFYVPSYNKILTILI